MADVDIDRLKRDYEGAICRIVLYCIMELPMNYGVHKTIAVLRGSYSTFMIDHDLNQSDINTYALLSNFSNTQLRDIIDILIQAGLIKREYVTSFQMPILTVSEQGYSFIRGEYAADIKFIENLFQHDLPQIESNDMTLFQQLRTLRKNIAKDLQIPAYWICIDRALFGLTRKKPTTKEDLLSVHGIGDTFVEKYGERFIETINSYVSTLRESINTTDQDKQNSDICCQPAISPNIEAVAIKDAAVSRYMDNSIVRITPELINQIIMPNGYLSVPTSIINAISKCIKSTDLAQIEEAKLYYKEYFSKRGRECRPLNDIEYVGSGRIDAYAIHYLPRNTFIPGFAFSCLSYHPEFQIIPRNMKILDLGSGTGAIALGLLHLSNYLGLDIDLLCLDRSGDALTRQLEHIKCMWKRPNSCNLNVVDFADKNSYAHIIDKYGPYDMIFAANIFSELPREHASELMSISSNYMSKNGVFVYCDASGRYNCDQFPVVLKKAASIGLHTYYPCQPCVAPNMNCWYWRTDNFVCPDMDILGNKINIATDGSNINKTYMALLCKSNYNIFDYLTHAYPEIHWGLLKRNSDKASYSCCTSHGTIHVAPNKSELTEIRNKLHAEIGKGIFAGVGVKSGKIEYLWDFLKGVMRI